MILGKTKDGGIWSAKIIGDKLYQGYGNTDKESVKDLENKIKFNHFLGWGLPKSKQKDYSNCTVSLN